MAGGSTGCYESQVITSPASGLLRRSRHGLKPLVSVGRPCGATLGKKNRMVSMT